MKPSPFVQADILFEIGTEELPATNLADFFDGSADAGIENPLVTRFKKALDDHRLSAAQTVVWATPRRLVFWAKDVPAIQKELTTRTRLLSKDEAYGPDGAPTEKLLTILKHRNAKPEDVVPGDFNGKPAAFLEKREPSRKTSLVLPELCAALVQSVGFPKNMKWDDSGLFFARPIRSLLCFYGSKPVAVRLGNLKSKPETSVFAKGRRTVLPVKDIPGYFKQMEKSGVILDPALRKKALRDILEKLAKASGSRLYDDPFLLNEVNFLVESPQGLSAPFGEEYLSLPLEVLAVSMARKQRIFGLIDSKNRVHPRFLAILDGAVKEKEKKIISGNMEHILHAKLQDSLFFWKEDSKMMLEKKREDLKNLVFLKGAGSMLQKSERLFELAQKGDGSQPDYPKWESHAQLARAARLSKADLLTHMVGEFPELQGVMGKYYAKLQGESDEVCEAIGEQYLPRTVSDRLPKTKTGALLSLLDKVDLVAACFALGLEPTSSQDPYGLRRSASAVIKIIFQHQLQFSSRNLFEGVSKELRVHVSGGQFDGLEKKLGNFFKDRLKAVLADRGFQADLIEAVLVTRDDVYLDVLHYAEKLKGIRNHPEFAKAQKSIERTSNILKGVKERKDIQGAVSPEYLLEPAEKELWKRFEAAEKPFCLAAGEGDYGRATRLYAEAFFDILGEFFEKVFINAEDPAVRRNRLALVRSVKELYTANIADLSKIQI